MSAALRQDEAFRALQIYDRVPAGHVGVMRPALGASKFGGATLITHSELMRVIHQPVASEATSAV